MQQFRTSRIEL